MYLLLGYGKSNQSIEKYFIKKNIKYIVYDDYNKKNNIDLNNIDVVIKSNGIRNDHFILEEARYKNIKIISDLQLYFNITKNENSCLVTGSNGKTTIVSLLERTINEAIAIGNNSLALFDYVDEKKYRILEVSSFMLESTNFIKYKYNIISNIYPTHLEHHKTFINYIKSKISFMKNLSRNDYIIYSKDDIILNKILEIYEVNKITVSLKDTNATIYYKNDIIYYKNKKLMSTNNLKLIGKHNLYNVMLVIGVLINHPFTKENYRDIICSYNGEKYRLQKIYDGDFKIINDSKSTNFNALRVALESFKDNIVLIVGGMKRNDNFSLLDNQLIKIKSVYCYGENKDEFFDYFFKNQIKCYKFNNIEEIVNNIKVVKNDIVLFSPGSISHDQFDDFEHRGEVFNSLIKNKYFF